MKSLVKLSRIFAFGLISLIAISSTHLIDVQSQEKGAQGEEIMLAEGTPLNLVVAQAVSSKTANPGDVVKFKVDEDMVVNGHVVINKGTPATGSVINAEKSGRMGKSGKLAVAVESTTTADGQPLKLRAAKGKEGAEKTNSVMVLSMIVSPLFLLKKGEDATIKEGTKVTVYVDETRRFQVSGSSLVAATEQPANPNAASTETSGAANDSAKEMATVYIYRPGKLVGKALAPSVFCDGVELARLENGRYLTLKLKPGKHLVHMTDTHKGYEVNMGGGQEYYFRIGIEAGMWKGQGKITLDDNERGAAEIKKIKPLESDKIKDHTMVVAEANASKKD